MTIRPAAWSARQAGRAELWRLALVQALAAHSGAAAAVGLRSSISFNTRGLRLMVSGYGGRAPELLLLLLRKAGC